MEEIIVVNKNKSDIKIKHKYRMGKDECGKIFNNRG